MRPMTDAAGDYTPDGLKQRLVRLAEGLKRHRHDWEEHYRELAEFVLPRRGRWDNQSTHHRGKMLNRRILNSTGTLALRTLQSGMQTGITSPARPWFRLIPADYELRNHGAIKAYTNDVERILRQYFQSTGAYNSLHTGYGDLGLYGTDCAILEPHPRQGFILHQLVPGEFWVGANDDNMIDTLYHETWMTVEQIVGRFVYGGSRHAQPQWGRATSTIKNLWDKGQRNELILVSRYIAPRYNRDPVKLTDDNKPVMSVWWEQGSSGDQVLRNSGYDINPIIASRWFKTGMEVYGRSPGMDALPDVKALQTQERDKGEAIQRMNRPPMNAPTAMRNTPFSLMPGAVNFTDIDRGMFPAYEINPPVQELREDIRETEDRVNQAFYADLFLMMSRLDRRQITAREVDERSEEKLIGLGPVLELQHREKLRPLIMNAFTILDRAGLLPEPPAELDGRDMQIDYISMLAQAQKAVSTGGVERLAGFVGNMAAVKPTVLDKIDEDEAVEEYADMLGTPARIVRPQDEVDALRQERAEQEAQQAQLDAASQAAPAAREGAQAAQILADASEPRGEQPGDVLRRIGLRGGT